MENEDIILYSDIIIEYANKLSHHIDLELSFRRLITKIKTCQLGLKECRSLNIAPY